MEILYNILDAYAYEIVFVDRNHIVRYMNKTAKQRYGSRVQVGNSLFNCHNENSKKRIEVLNGKTGEREFFVPVKDASKKVIGYFERHEMFWSKDKPEAPIFEYWKSKN